MQSSLTSMRQSSSCSLPGKAAAAAAAVLATVALQQLCPCRSPQLIFAHFHFLLEHTHLLTRFVHIVHAQPFHDRKTWFYQNLYQGKAPSNELTLAAQSNAILVDRGAVLSSKGWC